MTADRDEPANPYEASRQPHVLAHESLGPMLLECQHSRAIAILFTLFAIATTTGMGVALRAGGAHLRDLPLLAGLAFMFAFAAWSFWRVRFRVFERGVAVRSSGGETLVRYDEIGGLSYWFDLLGSPINSSATMIFRTNDGRRPVFCSVSVRPADAPRLRQVIAGIERLLTERMSASLARGESVAWTRTLTLTPEGIRHEPRRWFRAGPMEFYPYSDIGQRMLGAKGLTILSKRAGEWAIWEPNGAENLAAGYETLRRILGDNPMSSDLLP